MLYLLLLGHMMEMFEIIIILGFLRPNYMFTQVGAQTSIKMVEFELPLFSNISARQQFTVHDEVSYFSKSWMTVKEPIGIWSKKIFSVQGILEHLNVTKDHSDYLWYITR